MMFVFAFFGCRGVLDADGGLCPAWSGLDAEGEGRMYEDFATETAWVEAVVSVDGDVVTVEGDTSVSQYRCDADGAWAIGWREDDGETWTEGGYDPAALVMPRHLEVGVTWTTEAAWNTLASDGTEATGSAATQFLVTAEAETWVPAGDWTTLEVEVLRDGPVGDDAAASEDTWYYARDIGVVLTETYQLVAVGTVD